MRISVWILCIFVFFSSLDASILIFEHPLEGKERLDIKHKIKDIHKSMQTPEALYFEKYLLVLSMDTSINPYQVYLSSLLKGENPVCVEKKLFVLSHDKSLRHIKEAREKYRANNIDVKIYKNLNSMKKKYRLDRSFYTKLVPYLEKSLKVKKIDTSSILNKDLNNFFYMRMHKKARIIEKLKEISAKKPVVLKKYLLMIPLKKEGSTLLEEDTLAKYYFMSLLLGGNPIWLEDGLFVFDSALDKKSIYILQKQYQKYFKIKLSLYENTFDSHKKFLPMQIDFDRSHKWIIEKLPVSLKVKKAKKRQHKLKKKREKHVKKIIIETDVEDSSLMTEVDSLLEEVVGVSKALEHMEEIKYY